MSEELLKPADVCRRLGMPPSTLRIYSTKFGELLSEGARRSGGSGGVGSHRLYNSRDLVVLTRGKELLAQGLTYERALEELRRTMPAPSGRGRLDIGRNVSSVVAEGSGEESGRRDEVRDALDLVRAAISNNERALAMYKELADEQGKEIGSLRERIVRIEVELEQVYVELRRAGGGKKGIWERLGGG